MGSKKTVPEPSHIILQIIRGRGSPHRVPEMLKVCAFIRCVLLAIEDDVSENWRRSRQKSYNR
jgi:hypothetical protein